jgi:uncharacterized protein (TIRG00374 family)
MLASVFHKLHWRPAILLPNHQPLQQHPGDVLRLVLGTILLVVTGLIAAADALSKLETNIFRLINDLTGFLWLPLVQRKLITPLLSIVRKLVVVLRQPEQAAKLFLSSGSVSLLYALALLVCLRAFGSDVPALTVITVYQGGAALGAISPTPGGLGATEVALIAGLTAVGVPFGPAVTGVLCFRLLTYWLPILPGFAEFRYLEREQVG